MSRGLVIGESLIDIVQDGRQVTGEHVGGRICGEPVNLERNDREGPDEIRFTGLGRNHLSTRRFHQGGAVRRKVRDDHRDA